jgi:hypothetical protein
MRTPDGLAQLAYEALRDAADKPENLKGILDHDLLPTDEEELPVVGVYLADDRPAGDSSGNNSQVREAVVRVEIRAIGEHLLAATRIFREWVERTLLSLDLPDADVDLGDRTPFGIATNVRLAGADLDFIFRYSWRP